MKLNEVLSKQTVFSPAAAATYSADGDIQPDGDPDLFRLYTNPPDRGTYHLIKRADAPEVYPYTPEEIVRAGIIDSAMYRVQLKYGAVVQRVSISTFMVGMGARSRKADVACVPPCNPGQTCLGCECTDGSSCDPAKGCLFGSGPCTCVCA